MTCRIEALIDNNFTRLLPYVKILTKIYRHATLFKKSLFICSTIKKDNLCRQTRPASGRQNRHMKLNRISPRGGFPGGITGRLSPAIFFTRITEWLFESKIRILFVAYSYFAIPYLLLNHFHLFEPVELYLFPFEKSLPLVPSTIWIYLTDYFLPVLVLFLVKEDRHLRKLVGAFFTLLALHYLVFLFYPTAYPRVEVPADVTGLTGIAFTALHWIDTPANCFPSGHVSICYLGAFTMYHVNRYQFPFFLLWATLISFSTMTTKQHYFLDIISAVVLAYVVHFFFWRKGNSIGCREITAGHDVEAG